MNEKYTYSFIIPHHNSPELLNRCLDSIPQREDIQIIVVDDNSKADKKPQVTRTEVEVVYIDAAHTKGAGHARNEGLARAKGKWLLFADCDDEYTPGFIKILDSHKDDLIDVLYFNSLHIDSITKANLPKYGFQLWFENKNNHYVSDDFIRYKNNVPWNKMVLREFVENRSIRFEEVPNGNDIWFSLQVGRYANTMSFEKQPLYIYYKTQNSILTQKKQNVDKKICRIRHTLQKNAFYCKLGHPEWKASLIRIIAKELKKDSFCAAVILISNLIKNPHELFTSRYDWCKILI